MGGVVESDDSLWITELLGKLEGDDMKAGELIEHIDRDEGDLTAIRIDDEQDSVELHGVCGSVDDFDDFDLPKGKYIVLKAIDEIEVK